MPGLVKDIVTALQASDDVILNKIVAGHKTSDVVWDTLLFVVNSEGLKNSLFALLEFIFDRMGGATQGDINDAAKKLLDFTAALDLGLQLMDTAVSGLQVAVCDLADQFTLEVTKSNVKLNPLNPNIDGGSGLPTNFTLSVIDSDVTPGVDLKYHWSCSSLFGDISDVDRIGTSFDSNHENLAYNPRRSANGLGGDQDVVIGTVYLSRDLNMRVPLGQASSTVTYNAPIAPASPSLTINTNQTFTAGISTKLLQSGRSLKYVWTVAGGHGTVGGAATQTTDTPSVVYRAGAGSGSDTLSLKVIDLLNVVYTSGSTQIGVANALFTISPPSIDIASPLTVYSFDAQGAAGLPTDTTYRWTTKSGNVAPPNTSWTNDGTKQIVGGSRAYYSVPEAFPTNGVGKTDTVMCEALSPAGNVLASAQATVTYGDRPYVRYKYYDTQASRVLDIPVTSGISVTRATNPFAGTDLFEISVADGNGGAVFDARLVVAVGANLTGSFTFVSASGLNANLLVPGQGYFLGRLHSPQITGGVLTVNSSVSAPGGGTYVGFSFNWDTTMSGSPVVGNGVVLLTP